MNNSSITKSRQTIPESPRLSPASFSLSCPQAKIFPTPSNKAPYWFQVFNQKVKLFRPQSMHLIWCHDHDFESTQFIQKLQDQIPPAYRIALPNHDNLYTHQHTPILWRLRALSQQCLNLYLQATSQYRTKPKLIIINNFNQLLNNDTFFEIDSLLQTLQQIAIQLKLSVLLQHINYHPTFALEALYSSYISPYYFDNIIGVQQAFRDSVSQSHIAELILLKHQRERFLIDLSH